jgi:hypothetical protein
MQIAGKATEVEFKLYSLCQQNYLYDFLFISKIWSQNVENLSLNDWFSSQRVKISELKSAQQLNFSSRSWKLTSSSLLIIQLCKSLSSDQSHALFVDNFFTNAKLFKALKTMNIETCETTKVESEFLKQLIRLRASITKKKHWEKMNLMITECNRNMNIDDKDTNKSIDDRTHSSIAWSSI